MSAATIRFDDGAVYERMMGTWSGLIGGAFVEGEFRVLRGGGWRSLHSGVRSAFRIPFPAGARVQEFGFRVGRTLDP